MSRNSVREFFSRLDWQEDRVLLDQYLFYLKHALKNKNEFKDDGFVLTKTQELMKQYEGLWQAHREFSAENILEFGIWDGGSIVLWYEMFQPMRHVAVDLMRRTDSAYFERYLTEKDAAEKIRTFWDTDQSDEKRLREILREEFRGPLDLVVDDASHLYELTKKTFDVVFPSLREGGLYIIEDWAWAHWRGFEQTFKDRVPLTRLIFELVEAAGTSPRLIKHVFVYQGFVAVERGPMPVDDIGEFKLDSFIYRHPVGSGMRSQSEATRLLDMNDWGRALLGRLKRNPRSK